MNNAEKQVAKAQLNSEDKTLKELQAIFKKAKKDTQSKIAELNARTDMQNLQSIIYQKKYQEAILTQIESTLKELSSGQYKTVEQFLTDSYDNGYLGMMYSLQQQGIPMTIPIDDRKVVRALTTDSQLSSRYYQANPVRGRLEENVSLMKDRIRSNLSRGIVAGKSWLEVANDIASGMNNPFDKAMKDSMRIVRTEGHRVNQQGFLDAGDEAKKKGADIVKQWDATLDGLTRPAHREADGQIREWDEPFDVWGEKLKAPSIGGSARNVCNCRCQMLQRARWALDEAELETLKERAKFFGLDKSKDFEDYKKKYLTLPKNADSMKVDIASLKTDLTDLQKKIGDNEALIKQNERKLKFSIYSDSEKEQLRKDNEKYRTELEALRKEQIEKGKLYVSHLNTTFTVSTDNEDFVRLIINDLMPNVEYREVMKLDSARSIENIVSVLGGGDKTSGSCASVGLAYIGRSSGLDVLDFRGGESMNFFSSKKNKRNMWDALGVNYFFENSAKSSLTNGKRILSNMQVGKEYYLGVGGHASIVRVIEKDIIDQDTGEWLKTVKNYQYLELQSSNECGWTDFSDNVGDTLLWRFGCTSSSRYVPSAMLTEVSQLENNDEFRTILGYLNTAESEQRKGSSGTIK